LLSYSVPDPGQWQLDCLASPNDQGCFEALIEALLDCGEAAYQVSEEIGALYFTHSGDGGRSLGA
jgi:hypothetical protein